MQKKSHFPGLVVLLCSQSLRFLTIIFITIDQTEAVQLIFFHTLNKWNLRKKDDEGLAPLTLKVTYIGKGKGLP